MAMNNADDDNSVMEESNIALPLVALKVAQEDLSSIANKIEELFLANNARSKATLFDDLPSTSTAPQNSSQHGVTEFYSQLSAICSETRFKLMQEAHRLNTNFKRNIEIALQEEKNLHLNVQLKLATEIKDLQQSVESHKNALLNSDCIVLNLLGALQKQREHVLLVKSFFNWKLYCERRQRKRFMTYIAVKHYEKKLKQRVICAWLDILKSSWKNKMELKANVDVLEQQKCIVETYESKIRKLEENLSEAGRNIDLLQTKHKSNEDTVQAALRHGRYSLNTDATNVICDTSDDTAQDFRATEERTLSYSELGKYDLCSDCAYYMSKKAEADRYSNFIRTPTNVDLSNVVRTPTVTNFEKVKPGTSKVHPSSKVKDFSGLNTKVLSHRTCSYVSENGTSYGLPRDLRKRIIVERHVPFPKQSLGVLSCSRERNQKAPQIGRK